MKTAVRNVTECGEPREPCTFLVRAAYLYIAPYSLDNMDLDVYAELQARCPKALCVIEKLRNAAVVAPGAVDPRYNVLLASDPAPASRWHCVDTLTSSAAEGQPMQENGRLDPVVIQKAVRESARPMQRCYDAGLRRHAMSGGRVSIRFVIGRDGYVSKAAVAATDLPDCEVARCVRDVFAGLSFPKPGKGSISVVYPVRFERASNR